MSQTYKNRIQESIDLHQMLFSLEDKVTAVAKKFTECLKQGGKIIFFGNGGSASDSMHLAAEYVNKFSKVRKSLPALALTSDVSVLTAIANDFDYSYIFKRQLESLAGKNDVVVALSTSGESKNVLQALEYCKEQDIFSISFTRGATNSASKLADLPVNIPSESTPRVQEVYLLINHTICELVDENLGN